MGRYNNSFLAYTKPVSCIGALVAVATYFIAGYINGNYPTYEDKDFSQLIYGLLAIISVLLDGIIANFKTPR